MCGWDAFALSCDYIVPVARIKPHTDFHGPFESGIMKMLAIGLASSTAPAFAICAASI